LDARLLILGVNVLGLSAVLGIYGALTGSTQLLGVAASLTVVGATAAVAAFAHREPEARMLEDYTRLIAPLAVKVLEDLRLTGSLPTAIRNGDSLYLAVANPEHLEKLASTGSTYIGLVDGAPAVVLEVPRSLLEELRGLAGAGDAESRLRSVLVEAYSAASTVTLTVEGGTARLRLDDVSPRLIEEYNHPLSPLDTLTTLLLADALEKSVSMKSRVVAGNTYMAEYEVVG